MGRRPSPGPTHPPDTVAPVPSSTSRVAGSSELLRGLTAAQQQAVVAPDAPLCVLAAAGSGKTTVLARRVARRILDGSARAEHTLVVTFTRKASRELRGRLARLGVPGLVSAGTFHAVALAQLRRHWADQELRPPVLVDDPTAPGAGRARRARLGGPGERRRRPRRVALGAGAHARARGLHRRRARRRVATPCAISPDRRGGGDLRGIPRREEEASRARPRRPRDALRVAARGGRGGRRGTTVAHPPRLRRRVPRRQPRAVAPAAAVARGGARPVRGGRPPTGHLRVERGRPHAPRSTPRAPARHRRPAPRRQPPLHAPGGRGGERRARGRSRRGVSPRRPLPRGRRIRRRRGRGRRRWRGGYAAPTGPGVPGRTWPCWLGRIRVSNRSPAPCLAPGSPTGWPGAPRRRRALGPFWPSSAECPGRDICAARWPSS